MYSNPEVIKSGNNLIDQLSSVLQLRACIRPGCEGSSHESPPVAALGHDDLCENGLIELHKLTPGLLKVG